MDGPMTFNMAMTLIGSLVTVLFASGVMWRAYYNKLRESEREYSDRLREAERQYRAEILALQKNYDAQLLALHGKQVALEIQMTRDYVSLPHLEKVEDRLIGAVDRLIVEVKGLREAVAPLPKPPTR